MDYFADELEREERSADRIDDLMRNNGVDDVIKRIVPDSGSGIDDLYGPEGYETARAYLAQSGYSVEVEEVIEEPLVVEGKPRDPLAVMRAHEVEVEARLRSHRGRDGGRRPPRPAGFRRRSDGEGRPRGRTRRSPRTSRAGPSSDDGGGEPEPPDRGGLLDDLTAAEAAR